jgi:hypothetical protein
MFYLQTESKSQKFPSEFFENDKFSWQIQNKVSDERVTLDLCMYVHIL